MHTEILAPNQLQVAPFLKEFKRSFYLVGGTAIALHIGHRRSIDFDLFTFKKLNKSGLKLKLSTLPFDKKPIFEDYDQLHLLINEVKLTFFSYPFEVNHPIKSEIGLMVPSLLSLAAMKAYALGRRSKWKDYVDLYFIIKNFHSVEDIAMEANGIFNQMFSEKLFRQQLAFHKDIDYSEPVEFLGPSFSEREIKDFLIDKATDIF